MNAKQETESMHDAPYLLPHRVTDLPIHPHRAKGCPPHTVRPRLPILKASPPHCTPLKNSLNATNTRKLTAHKSCVNYLAFSRHDGRWLASAGDDFCVQLWDFSQEDVKRPAYAFTGPIVSLMPFCRAGALWRIDDDRL